MCLNVFKSKTSVHIQSNGAGVFPQYFQDSEKTADVRKAENFTTITHNYTQTIAPVHMRLRKPSPYGQETYHINNDNEPPW